MEKMRGMMNMREDGGMKGIRRREGKNFGGRMVFFPRSRGLKAILVGTNNSNIHDYQTLELTR